jgi:POT family proton-dependent oligopeptide transporter
MMGAMAFASAAHLVPLLIVALGLVALGNGFFKPNISAMVGRLPHRNAAAADAAFGTFYVWVNMGAAAASLIAGYAADRFGWHLAFSLAAIGMAIALILMRLFAATAIDPVASVPGGAAIEADSRTAPDGWLPALLAILLLSVLFAVALYQVFGTISLFAERRVDRDVLGFTIPTGWFLALNPIVMILLMPPLARAWREGRGPGHAWPPTTKMRTGFLILALAFTLLLAAVLQARDGLASPLWIIGCVVLITTAELFIGPVALAAVSRLAPPDRAVAAMGGFVAALGIGGLGAGQLGALAATLGPLPVVSSVILGALLTAVLVWQLAPWFARRGV